MNSSLLIILTGKTASGKDTIVARIRQKYPNLRKIITTTSRKIREGEEEGKDYHFLTEEEFRSKIDAGDFVEYVEYGGNLYGTEKRELNNLSDSAIWRIDPSRAGKIRDLIKNKKIVVIYINAPEEAVLERLRERNLPEGEIENRMADDEAFFQQFKGQYDYIIENSPGKLEGSVDRIIEILENSAS